MYNAKIPTITKRFPSEVRNAIEVLSSYSIEQGSVGKISRPDEVFLYLKKYANKKVEHFLAIDLDGVHKVIQTRVVSVGLVNRTVVHPREVFAPALIAGATAIIVAHNHPSGNLDPSPEDIEITERLNNAGEVLGIALLDHIIISRFGYYSMVQHGKFDPSKESS